MVTGRSAPSPPVEGTDGLTHSGLTFPAQFRKDRERQNLPAELLGDGQCPCAPAQRGEALLQVKGNRIIYAGGDSAVAKVLGQRIAPKSIARDLFELGLTFNGYVKEYDVERFYRDQKLLDIGEGTSEVQRIVISRYIGC